MGFFKKAVSKVAGIGGEKGGGLLAGKLGFKGLGANALGGGTGLLASAAVDALGNTKKKEKEEEKNKTSQLLALLALAGGGEELV